MDRKVIIHNLPNLSLSIKIYFSRLLLKWIIKPLCLLSFWPFFPITLQLEVQGPSGIATSSWQLFGPGWLRPSHPSGSQALGPTALIRYRQKIKKYRYFWRIFTKRKKYAFLAHFRNSFCFRDIAKICVSISTIWNGTENPVVLTPSLVALFFPRYCDPDFCYVQQEELRILVY